MGRFKGSTGRSAAGFGGINVGLGALRLVAEEWSFARPLLETMMASVELSLVASGRNCPNSARRSSWFWNSRETWAYTLKKKQFKTKNLNFTFNIFYIY